MKKKKFAAAFSEAATVHESAFHASPRVRFTLTLMRRSLRFCQLAANLEDNFMLTSLGGPMEMSIFLPSASLLGRLDEEDGMHS